MNIYNSPIKREKTVTIINLHVIPFVEKSAVRYKILSWQIPLSMVLSMDNSS